MHKWLWGGCAATVLAVAITLALVLPSGEPATMTVMLPKQTYHLTFRPVAGEPPHGRAYYAAVAHTPVQQYNGLSNIPSMPADRGMIFIYTSDQQRCFWMKDMRFPIDMIWLDHTKTVTHIEPNVSPSTYPRTFCNTGTYVVELNAGEAVRAGLKIGEAVTF